MVTWPSKSATMQLRLEACRALRSDLSRDSQVLLIGVRVFCSLVIEDLGIVQVAKKELKLECDYGWEARCQARFVQLIDDDPDFKDVMHVPKAVPELCSSSVLCSERVAGVHIDKVGFMCLIGHVQVIQRPGA